jgi:hypothetical protein
MKKLASYILEVVILSLLMSLPPLFVWIDFTILNINVSEWSLTELTQELALLASFGILFVKTYKNRQKSGFLTLLMGLFLVMFIREGDYFWDKIMRGLWTILAIVTFFITVYFAYKQRETIFPSLSTHWNTRGFGYLMVGLLTVLLFSRIFGTGSLWRVILKENYMGDFKTAVQEGLELLGYLLLFYGVVSISKKTQ